MNEADSILKAILEKAEINASVLEGSEPIQLTKAQIDRMLEHAYEQGIHDGRRSVFKEDDDLGAQLFQQLMASLPDHVYFKDLQSRFICVNQSMARYFGFEDPKDVVGKSDFDFFSADSARKKFEAEQAIIREGKGWSFREERDLMKSGNRWVISSKLPLHDSNGKICGTFGLSRDITKQKNAEREVLRQRRLMETIIQILPCRLFLRDREGRYILVNQEYRNCLGIPDSFDVTGQRLTDVIEDPRVDRILAEDLEVIETGVPITNKLEYDKSILAGNRWVLTSKVPIRSESGETEGIVGMSLDITEQKRAEDLAQKAKEALQVKNAQYEEELLVARQLQEQLMSMGFSNQNRFTKIHKDWTFQAGYLYDPSHHLAGDFFYLLPIDQSRVGVLVCDVMGHGVKAALVTMLIRGLMTEIPDILGHPSRVLQHLNETLIALAEDEEFPRFVTAAYMIIDLEKGQAIIANAGHPSPIIKSDSAFQAEYQDCPCDIFGPALGLLGGETFGDTHFDLPDDAEIYLFTDGIIEQPTKYGHDFGKEGLIEALKSSSSSEVEKRVREVKSQLADALGGQPTTDDICLVALKVSAHHQPAIV